MFISYQFLNAKTLFFLLAHQIKRTIFSLSYNALNRKTASNDQANSSTTSNLQPAQRAEFLLAEYGNAILRLAYSYLHQVSDAEDVLQDTIIQYLRTNPSFENAAHEKAWLLRVAINISKNKLISNKKRETVEIDEDLFVEEEKDLRFVWDAVKSLPYKYREVIHLFYQEGYSTAEIAKILNKNESTIRSLLHRSRGKLKEILKEDYDFNE